MSEKSRTRLLHYESLICEAELVKHWADKVLHEVENAKFLKAQIDELQGRYDRLVDGLDDELNALDDIISAGGYYSGRKVIDNIRIILSKHTGPTLSKMETVQSEQPKSRDICGQCHGAKLYYPQGEQYPIDCDCNVTGNLNQSGQALTGQQPNTESHE